jgi:hypothetical protein
MVSIAARHQYGALARRVIFRGKIGKRASPEVQTLATHVADHELPERLLVRADVLELAVSTIVAALRLLDTAEG